MSKHVQLPKFNSPKNPFATGGRTEAAVESAPPTVLLVAPEPVRMSAPVAAQSEETLVPKNIFAAPKLAGMAVRTPRAVGAQALRAARWLGEWGQKMNPMPWITRRRGPVRLAVNNFKPPAVQTELSLDTVKVVRNDLSDADLEVVLVTKPIAPNQNEQLVMASVGGREPEGGSFNRLSSWMFGVKSS